MLLSLTNFTLNNFCSGSPSHPSMMAGPMPVGRGPGQGPRGTGASMRGPMGRGDYGKYYNISETPVLTLPLTNAQFTRVTVLERDHAPHYAIIIILIIIIKLKINKKRKNDEVHKTYIICNMICY